MATTSAGCSAEGANGIADASCSVGDGFGVTGTGGGGESGAERSSGEVIGSGGRGGACDGSGGAGPLSSDHGGSTLAVLESSDMSARPEPSRSSAKAELAPTPGDCGEERPTTASSVIAAAVTTAAAVLGRGRLRPLLPTSPFAVGGEVFFGGRGAGATRAGAGGNGSFGHRPFGSCTACVGRI